MPLLHHDWLDVPSTFGADSRDVTRIKLNDNFEVCAANDELIEARLEDTWYDCLGSGVISGLEPALPSGGGLRIEVASGIALIGHTVSVEGTSVSVLGSASPGYVFLCQDGTWHVDTDNTPPDDKASLLYATYTSDETDVLSVTLASRGVVPARLVASVPGAISTGAIFLAVADRDLWIERVSIVVADSGSSGSTTVDVLVGDPESSPASIFASSSDKPSVPSGSAMYTTDDSDLPSTQEVSQGQVIVISVDEAATGASGLGVTMACRVCDL